MIVKVRPRNETHEVLSFRPAAALVGEAVVTQLRVGAMQRVGRESLGGSQIITK